MKKIISLILAVLIALPMMCTTAFAANNDFAPYGYSWYDSESKVWHIQIYEYDAKAKAYRISDRVVLKDSLLYDMAGRLIVSDVAEYAEAKPTVVFDSSGTLYFVSTKGETRRMDCSLNPCYAVSAFNSKYFEVDIEGLATKAVGKSSTEKLSSLNFTGSYARHLDPVITEGYVKTYAVDGNPEKVGYDAYFDNNVVSTIHCKDSSVWSETFKLMVSESSKGAKFVGFTAQYGIALYDISNKSIKVYNYEEGYKVPYTLYTDVLVYYYTKTSQGFVSGFVSDKGTFAFSTELRFPGSTSNGSNNGGNGNSASVSNVKNFQSKSMAYNGDALLGTLSLKESKVFWKGVEMTNSSNSVDIGISKSCTPFWINGDDSLYWFNGTTSQLVAPNVLRLKYDDNGRAIQYKASDGKWYDIW